METTYRVLLVDDIPDHLAGYETALRARGYDVAIAHHGDAVAAARSLRPDCIVIDERLGDMFGWDVCRELKHDPLLKAVPVVMLAQELTVEAALRGKHVGCDSWLAHPTVPDDLVRAVQDVLSRGTAAPISMDDAVLGLRHCNACGSPRIRAGVRVGPAQYHTCRDCGLRWRTEAKGEATA